MTDTFGFTHGAPPQAQYAAQPLGGQPITHSQYLAMALQALAKQQQGSSAGLAENLGADALLQYAYNKSLRPPGQPAAPPASGSQDAGPYGSLNPAFANTWTPNQPPPGPPGQPTDPSTAGLGYGDPAASLSSLAPGSQPSLLGGGPGGGFGNFGQ
jgi:hypothetical protein